MPCGIFVFVVDVTATRPIHSPFRAVLSHVTDAPPKICGVPVVSVPPPPVTADCMNVNTPTIVDVVAPDARKIRRPESRNGDAVSDAVGVICGRERAAAAGRDASS
jgi:hypothetical protein